MKTLLFWVKCGNSSTCESQPNYTIKNAVEKPEKIILIDFFTPLTSKIHPLRALKGKYGNNQPILTFNCFTSLTRKYYLYYKIGCT